MEVNERGRKKVRGKSGQPARTKGESFGNLENTVYPKTDVDQSATGCQKKKKKRRKKYTQCDEEKDL